MKIRITKKTLFFSLFLIVVIISAAVVNFSLKQKQSTSQKKDYTPSVLKRDTSYLESCNVTKEGNPLVHDVQTIGDIKVGSFRGNINSYTLAADKKSAQIQLVSQFANQAHDFTLVADPHVYFDATTQKDITLQDIKRAETVDISFNCFPKDNNRFVITRVAVIGKLK